MEKKDSRIQRLWYFTGALDSIPQDWAEISKHPHVFLTNAPLTFGHSQLVVPAKSGDQPAEESEVFRSASEIITALLKAYKTIFGVEKVHTQKEFRKLAEVTYSYGTFIKTLILRMSASEESDCEFKLHLVPYFESNQNECHKRFHHLHRAAPNQKGGLIGWLGDRETQVDKWLVDGFPGPLSLDDIGKDIWKLPVLANLLRKSLHRQRANPADAR